MLWRQLTLSSDLHEDFKALLDLYVSHCRTCLAQSLASAETSDDDALEQLSGRVLSPMVAVGHGFMTCLVDRPVGQGLTPLSLYC